MLVDVEEKSNYKSYKKVDVGFCTESALKDACVKPRKRGPLLVTNNLWLSGVNVEAFSLQL